MTGGVGFREEDDPHGERVLGPEVAGTVELEPLRLLLEERLRDDGCDARAVAGLATDPPPVFHGFQGGDGFPEHLRRGFPVEGGDAADPAGIVPDLVRIKEFATSDPCQAARHVHLFPPFETRERFSRRKTF